MNKKSSTPRGAIKLAASRGLVFGTGSSSAAQGPAKRAGVPALPQPTWTRYADSRLKQFVCR